MTEREDEAQARLRVAPGTEGPARCSGALAQLAVADVIQLLQLIGKSGVMTVTVAHQGGQSRLWCAEGSLIDAESGRLRGEAAAYRILSLDDGWLEAELRHEERPRTIHVPTQRLLLEAARRTDETLALKRKLGGMLCCYRLVHEPEPEQLAAPTAAELRLLRLLSGAPSLAELLAESDLGDLETLVALERWFEAGHLAKVGLRPDNAGALAAGKLEASPLILFDTATPAAAAFVAGAVPPARGVPSPGVSPSVSRPSVPSPSVPPLVASVPPGRGGAPSGARRASRSAVLVAGAVLLAAASFAGGYVLRDGAAGPATGTASPATHAGELLEDPARADEARATSAGARAQASAVGTALAAATPNSSARGESPGPGDGTAPTGDGTALTGDGTAPMRDGTALVPEVSAGEAGQQGSPAGSAAPPAARAYSAGKAAARLETGRTRGAAPDGSPVISEPRVRVIGVTEPSIRVLD